MEKKRKILIVDDDRQVLKLLRASLENHGFEVVEGCTGKEAVDLNHRQQPDLILMDLNMPEMGGIAACKLIKRQKKARYVPIILLTAQNRTEDKTRGLDSGADDYLTKPFEMPELLARIRSLLRIKHLTEQLQRTRAKLIEAKQLAAVAAAAVTVNDKINSPLTRIIINLEIVESKMPGPLRDLCRQNLNQISEAARKISALTKKMAVMSKPNFTNYLAGTTMLDIDIDDIENEK